MGFRTYPDGTEKVPHLGTFCTDPDSNHRVCGGWWCTCDCHDDWDIGTGGHIRAHVDHVWSQVGPCVYCEPCNVRLYQGQVALFEEKEAMAVIFDGIHEQTTTEWAYMREQVLAARGGV